MMTERFETASGPAAEVLADGYGRRIDYLRISVTDRCNLRCFYCMPDAGVTPISHDDILRYEELFEIIRVARSLGIGRFRITGGEPLVRRGLTGFLRGLSERGVDYSITTNGLLLGRFARELAEAGLRRVNVGLDSLRPERFERITLREGLGDILRGIDSARAAGIGKVKINVVVMKGVNDDEVDAFIGWARRENLDIRFIEFMPVYGEDLFFSLKPFIESFRARADVEPAREEGSGPAKSFRFTDGTSKVGFILPRTEPFCAGCNRMRLTAVGTLLPCLFSRDVLDIRGPLRRGEPIDPVIIGAVAAKPRCHSLRMKLHGYPMHALGG